MRPYWCVLGALALLGLAACSVPAGPHPAQAPQLAEQAFERSLPDSEAGAALQERLGNARLAGPDRSIERDAFELLARNQDRLVEDYISRYGKAVNTDDARELFPAYRADRSRAAAVHAPASELSRQVYARLLAENQGAVDEVIFLAGGAGSGKTTVLRVLSGGTAPDAITFDGTFANLSADIHRIRQALDTGYEVRVAYVHVENPLVALERALDRAERMAAEQGSGRTVPAEVLIEQHAKARRALIEAADAFKRDSRVSFQFIDNSGTLDDIRLVGSGADAVAFMRQRLYDAQEVAALKRQAEELVEARFRAGTISEPTYRGFSGRASQEVGSEARRAPHAAQQHPRQRRIAAAHRVGWRRRAIA